MSAAFLSRPLALAAAICAALLHTGAAAADDRPDRTELLQPSSGWNIDFGEDSCRLARIFGEGDNRHLVFFEQAGPGTGFGLTLAGPRLRQFRQIVTRLGLEEDEGFPRVNHNWGEVEGFGPAAIFSRVTINDPQEDAPEADGAPVVLRGLPQIDLEEAATIPRILFGHGGKALSFETGDMAPPLQALNVCAADFVRAWGLDAEKHTQFTRMAHWQNEAEIARHIQRKYTLAAVNRGEETILRMRVIIETDGSVSDCHLVEATVTERIDSNACEEMEEAVFEPALDADGQPMRSFYTTNIIYRITQTDAHG